jgi:hypothetical protein
MADKQYPESTSPGDVIRRLFDAYEQGLRGKELPPLDLPKEDSDAASTEVPGGVPTREAVAGDKPARRRTKRTSLDRVPGRRPIKEYPLTKNELWTLGGLQAGSGIAFSLAGICFGQWSSVKEQIAFANGSRPQVVGYWNGVGDMAWYGMIALLIIGVMLLIISGFNVVKIIKGTAHD